jgi:hypothetical protein
MGNHEHALRWRLTWDEKENDYTASAPTYAGPVGRVYLNQDGSWCWSMNADGWEISRNIGRLYGCAATAREAAAEVEESWRAAIRGTVHEQGLNPVAR